MKALYADNIIFYESRGGPAIEGFQATYDLIAGLHKQWLAELAFKLTQPSKVNHQVQQIFWTLGIPIETPVASGKV
jgi:hypothetical protein